MLVSALLTSVGINSGLCIMFFTLYSILRRQPANFQVYEPRSYAEKGIQHSSYFQIKWLLPSPGWVRGAWKLTESELLSLSGLDGVVFTRIIILKVFSLAGIIGVFILLPINCTGDQLEEFSIANISSDSLDIFTISNVDSGSKKLWVHFCAVYVVTVWVCYLLFYEYNYVSCKRTEYFLTSKPQSHQFTILVRGIPVPPGCSVSESVDNFFGEYHPSTYLSHTVIHRTSKLRSLATDANKMYKRLTNLQAEPGQQKVKRSGLFGLFGKKEDLVDKYEKKLEGIEENLQREASLATEQVRAAFVFFKSRYAAAVAYHLQQSTNPTQWVTERVPEPNDVYWPFFQTSFLRRWLSKVIVLVSCILLTILFLIPVVIVQGLTNLEQLEALFPFLESILSISVVSEIVTGYLPSLILQMFLKLVPPVMLFLSCIQGYISFSEIQKSACNKFLWFTTWNIFFANVLSGSVLNQLSLLLDLKNIPSKLAVAVPAQASFFIAYVVTSGWTSTSSELFRIIPFIGHLLKNCCCCCCCCKKSDDSTDEFKAPGIPYHVDIAKLLFFGLLGITYFFLAPLILPFLLIYYCLAYIVFKNQFIKVYEPKYDTAGRFWPIVHNSMIFSLILMQAIAIGIFTLKKLPVASTLIFPLPVLTLLFNEYCRKRFLPNFTGYAAESLIKKDREDSNDPAMDEFLNKLVTAYQDPALSPLKLSNNNPDIVLVALELGFPLIITVALLLHDRAASLVICTL
ncbi:hypothetical protein V2J09_015346 [Rumex salicifolius]